MLGYKARPDHLSSSYQYTNFDISSKIRAEYLMQAYLCPFENLGLRLYVTGGMDPKWASQLSVPKAALAKLP